jgi:hypothetical protein
MATEMTTEMTTYTKDLSNVIDDRLLNVALSTLGEATLTIGRLLYIATELAKEVTGTADQKIDAVCNTLRKVLAHQKTALAKELLAELEVGIDSIIRSQLTLLLTEIAEVATVGCFKSLWGLCISRAAVPIGPKVALPIAIPKPLSPSIELPLVSLPPAL